LSERLDQQLGELYGTLKGIVPALERLDDRQNEVERKVSAIEANHNGLRREFDLQQNNARNRDKDLYDKCHNAEKAHLENANAIETIQKDIKDLKDREQGFAQKAWDVFKILLAAAGAAATTYWITRGG
jgi:chromosome segregation ATPase